MALNLVYRNTDSRNRVEDLGKTLAPGLPVVSKAGLPATTVTGSADYVKTDTAFGMTLSGIPAGGVGLKGREVTLAFDGTWEYPVTGGTAATAQGVKVYVIAASNTLTTTAGSNVGFGYIDWSPDYDRTRGVLPVRIGA